MVEGARASSKIPPMTTKRRVRRPLHHASRGPPPRYRGGGKTKHSRSHGAIFVRARVFHPTIFSNAFPSAPFLGFSLCPPRPQTKGEAERRETRSLTRALRARGCPHPDPPPLAGRDRVGAARLSASHCGSGQGDSWSPRPGTRPCFRGAVRSVRSCTAASTGRRRPCASPRALPAPEKRTTVPVQRAPRMPVVVPAG